MLGWIAEQAFKDQLYVELHSFPAPNGKLFCLWENYERLLI